MINFFWVQYRTRYCPFLFRTSGEMNVTSLSLFIERWAAWFNRSLQMLQIWLGKVFQTGSLLLGGQDAANCTGSSQSSSVSRRPISTHGSGQMLSPGPAMPPEDNINSACGSLGALSCPPPGGICLSVHRTVVSALPGLPCDYWLIFILKSKMTPPTVFSWSRWGNIQKVPSTDRVGAVATSNTAVVMVQLFVKWMLCAYICMYICMYILWPSPLEEKLFSLQWPATVGENSGPFSKEDLFEVSPPWLCGRVKELILLF